jgi:NTE family protein
MRKEGIMAYHFKNLVFEGGGVKGIAYIGAMQVLKEKGVLDNIKRVGGTSAGAINATMFALGYDIAEQRRILKKMDFNNFMDDSWGMMRDTERLVEKFGWYKGDFFHDWISGLINKKLRSPNATFRDLQAAGRPALYVYGTNLSTRFGEVFSVEHTPTTRIADAVRISMSIPLFFAAFRNIRNDVYVDGGLLNNFPVKLFDRDKYIDEADRAKMGVETQILPGGKQPVPEKAPHCEPLCLQQADAGFSSRFEAGDRCFQRRRRAAACQHC